MNLEGHVLIKGEAEAYPVSCLQLEEPWSVSKIKQLLFDNRSGVRREVLDILQEHDLLVGSCKGVETLNQRFFEPKCKQGGEFGSSLSRSDMLPHTHAFTTFLTVNGARKTPTGIMHPRLYLEAVLSFFDSFVLSLIKMHPQFKPALEQWRTDVQKKLDDPSADFRILGRYVEMLAGTLYRVLSKRQVIQLRSLLTAYQQDRFGLDQGQTLEVHSPWEGPGLFKVVGGRRVHFRVVYDMEELQEENPFYYYAFN